MRTSNYAINPTPEQALRSNRAVLPARVIAALEVAGGGMVEFWIVLFFALVVGSAVHGWLSDKSTKLKQDEFNRSLKEQLSAKERQLELIRSQVEARAAQVAAYRREFEGGYIQGRRWLAAFVAEADKAFDDAISDGLAKKKHPARKAAEEVSIALAEKRKCKEQVKFLEYQLRSLKEYFPFLEEYEDVILDEAITLGESTDNKENLEKSDPVLLYVAKADYERLQPCERNQLALDRYLGRSLSKVAVGRLYERYLGFLYESDGWKVQYHGILEGFEDLGRDLICRKGGRVSIVQAKCWSAEKLIHEKHIFQLYGTMQLFLLDQGNEDLFPGGVSAEFVTTTSLSPVAKRAADWLKISVREKFAISKNYPMIKCNISRAKSEKIYHLPFDQQYDRTVIDPKAGEFYALTTAEAERRGFRRAFKFHGQGS